MAKWAGQEVDWRDWASVCCHGRIFLLLLQMGVVWFWLMLALALVTVSPHANLSLPVCSENCQFSFAQEWFVSFAHIVTFCRDRCQQKKKCKKKKIRLPHHLSNLAKLKRIYLFIYFFYLFINIYILSSPPLLRLIRHEKFMRAWRVFVEKKKKKKVYFAIL